MNLSAFTSKNLFDATVDIFEQLGIKLNSSTSQPLDARNHLKEHYKTWFDDKIKDSSFYFAGIVDDSIFSAGLFPKYTWEQANAETLANYDGLIVLALELKKPPKRAEISELTRAFNRVSRKLPVALVFKYEMNTAGGATETAVSIALSERFKYKQAWRPGEKAGKVTILRDIQVTNPHAGHIRILRDLQVKTAGIKTYDELQRKWLEVLDVNILNKNFFRELSNWYFWASKNVKFPDNPERCDDNLTAINLIRLVTRLIFIWFLKEKKFVREILFDTDRLKFMVKEFCAAPDSHNYYNAILQNLFFGTLNQKMTERKFAAEADFAGDQTDVKKNLYRYSDLFLISPDNVLELFKDIPFLNGGLFDCLDKRNEKNPEINYVDGFSRNPAKRALIPDNVFFGENSDVDLNDIYGTKNARYTARGLIKILDNYKFTITENTPLEEEVALDPELLGRVFENLLAYYNPETRTTARNQTGSFYTPREIVDFMVEESLIAYMKEKLLPESSTTLPMGENQREMFGGVKHQKSFLEKATVSESTEQELKEKLRRLFSFEEENPFDEEKTQKLINAIDTLKILDPACGSGAFPMGVLNKLVHVLAKLDPGNEHWRKIQKEKAKLATNEAYDQIDDKDERSWWLSEINDIFENNASDYGRKLFLIENCIHGVDIQPIAVQIAKLRFFIALIIEQNSDATKENMGVRSLPNLETKFVAADVLKELKESKQADFIDAVIRTQKLKLKNVRHDYFMADNRAEKDRLQKRDKELREEISHLLEANCPRSTTDQIAAFDLYDQNQSADWFHPEWMFNVTDGFDIVIGNPPYIQLQNNHGALAEKYKNANFETYARTGDIYALFYERAWKLLKNSSHLCFITSNKWMRAGYGESLRKFLAKKTYPLTLIDFAGQKIFESATVDTNILLYEKTEVREALAEYGRHTDAVIATEDCRNNLSDFVRQNATPCRFSGGESWVILNPIEQSIKAKIEKVGTPLKNWDISINYGIKTGYNEAFIIDAIKREEILNNCRTSDERKRTDELIRPILRGRDIKRYSYEWANLYIIATFPSLHIDIERYPAVKKHLLSFGMERLEQTGKIYTKNGVKITARKKTNNEWFETQDQIGYWDDFSKPKIVWAELARTGNAFTYDDRNYFVGNTGYILVMSGKIEKIIGYDFLLAILNSRAILFYLDMISTRLDETGWRWLKQHVDCLPIPCFPITKQGNIQKIIQSELQKKTTRGQYDIDSFVATVYGFNDMEVEFLQNFAPLD